MNSNRRSDPIIFDPQRGCLFARFSFQRWFWKCALSWSFILMNLGDAISAKLLGLGERLFIAAYERLSLRNPLRETLYRLGLWIQDNAWTFWGIGNWGAELFRLSYRLSGEEVLDALNEAIPYEHLSREMQALSDDWNHHVTLCLPAA